MYPDVCKLHKPSLQPRPASRFHLWGATSHTDIRADAEFSRRTLLPCALGSFAQETLIADNFKRPSMPACSCRCRRQHVRCRCQKSGLDEITPPDLGRVHAQLNGWQVHRPFDHITCFVGPRHDTRRPYRCWYNLNLDEDIVRSCIRPSAQQVAGMPRLSIGRRPGYIIRVDAECRDLAIARTGDFEVGDMIATMTGCDIPLSRRLSIHLTGWSTSLVAYSVAAISGYAKKIFAPKPPPTSARCSASGFGDTQTKGRARHIRRCTWRLRAHPDRRARLPLIVA